MTDPHEQPLDPHPEPMLPEDGADWASMFTLDDAAAGGLNARSTPNQDSPGVTAGASSTLERNLEALRRGSPKAADAIRAALPDPRVAFETAPDGGLTGTITDQATGKTVALASKRRPLHEGARIAESGKVAEHGLVVVLGFGVGHHVEAVARAMQTSGLVLVFEPDVGLLRAVFEQLDCSAWLSGANVALITDADDPIAVSRVFDGLEGVVGLGVNVIEHAPSLGRLGDRAEAFRRRLRRAIGDIRTTLVTTLAMSETTARNLLMNADQYAIGAGVNELVGSASGKPAIVVSAGPSLARNIELLRDPAVRERFVIIAVQTVLKTLLERGIRPHFVTALDYHEISTRFYEGLTAADVDGVRLIAEPKANPAILEAFPGEVIVAGSEALREFLPEANLPDRGVLPAGATVAHLAYDVARTLGCDPVVFVGQDLGFTDGQYYSQGAAIHGVWAGELSGFNTLEMMEWQRIARSKSLLHKRLDQNGRAIYLDEQMAAYLGQFEQQFERDRQHGLQTIDATEGGVAKHGTEPMMLRDAIDRFGVEPVGELPTTPAQSGAERAATLEQLAAAMHTGQRDAKRIEALCTTTAGFLREMEQHWDDVRARNRLITKVHECRGEVQSLAGAWRLTRFLDQSGTLERLRTDRRIDLTSGDDSQSATERRRAARDLRNVESLGHAAARAAYLYEHAREAALGRAPKMVRDPSLNPGAHVSVSESDVRAEASASRTRCRVVGMVIADFTRGALGNERSLDAPLDTPIDAGIDANGRGALWWTLSRVMRSAQLDAVVVLADDVDRARAVVGTLDTGSMSVRVERLVRTPADEARRASVARARLWSRSCWRGGIGGMTVFDEALEPGPIAHWLNETDQRGEARVDAVVACGADWVAVDPGIIDSLVERRRELGPQQQVCFSPAAPGFGVMVIDRDLVCDLADATSRRGRSPLATLGGALGYVPVAPRFDPIATPACMNVARAVRDAGVRAIADDPRMARALGAALAQCGPNAPAEAIVAALPAASVSGSRITLVVGTTADVGGQPSGWLAQSRATAWARARLGMSGGNADTRDHWMTSSDVARALEALIVPGSLASVTIDAVGDPFAAPQIEAIIDVVRAFGAGVHVRSPLLDDRGCELAAQCDVVSVDVLAGNAQTYAELTGSDSYDAVIGRIERLSRGPEHAGVLPAMWIVPRVTRCDAVLEQIEGLYDGSMSACGWCVIDPLPTIEPGERLRMLSPVPWARVMNDGVLVRPDGTRVAASFERAFSDDAAMSFKSGRGASMIESRAAVADRATA